MKMKHRFTIKSLKRRMQSFALLLALLFLSVILYPSIALTAEAQPIRFGEIYHVQNQWTGGKSYLDTCGRADCTNTTQLQVVTDKLPDRAGKGTGIWKIESATGEPDGSRVLFGDLVHLQNQWSGGPSYLDTCGRASCTDTTQLQVVTDKLPDRAGKGTGIWTFVVK